MNWEGLWIRDVYDRFASLTELISLKPNNCGPIIPVAYGHYDGAISAAHQQIFHADILDRRLKSL